MNIRLGLSILVLSLLTACSAQPATLAPAATTSGNSQPLFSDFKTIATDKGQFFQITPAVLTSGLQAKNFFFVNVHIPYAGEIEKTDAFIQYDQISLHFDELPADKNAPIVLYCRSGRMSGIAANTLADAGYTNVWDLAGGMVAWEAAGYEVIQK